MIFFSYCITKKVYQKVDSGVIKKLRHVSKNQIFAKWIDTTFIESKNSEIINQILDSWDKKQSFQRRLLSSLFKFLKSQDLSPNYKRVIEANRSSKYINFDSIKFMYNHPTVTSCV